MDYNIAAALTRNPAGGRLVKAGTVSGSTGGNGAVPTTWNTSTMCLRTIHRSLSAQVQNHDQLEIPLHEGDMEPLPRRPHDLGVGLWR